MTTIPSLILQESAHISYDVLLPQRGVRGGARIWREKGRVAAHCRPKDLLHCQCPETGNSFI